MKIRELRRKCEHFTNRVIAEGADPNELIGLLLGAQMRQMRARGITRELYLQGCALLWDENNTPDDPVEG
jgi:hypothetical protein